MKISVYCWFSLLLSLSPVLDFVQVSVWPSAFGLLAAIFTIAHCLAEVLRSFRLLLVDLISVFLSAAFRDAIGHVSAFGDFLAIAVVVTEKCSCVGGSWLLFVG